VVDYGGDADAAEFGDQLGCLLDRFRAFVVGPERARPAAAPGADDGCARLAEGGGDTPSRAPGRPGHDGDTTPQCVPIR
jgi:hypothetical protein